MAVALAGCQETIVLSEKAETFEAIAEGFESNTKTSIGEQKNIQWSENDQLAIFQGCSIADKYQVTAETAGTGNGAFELIADNSGDVNDDFNSGVEIATNIALYPYADGLSVSNTNVTNGNDVGAYKITGFVLPEIQHYVPNSFGEGTFPMVAVTETMSDHTLRFKNLMGAIKLQLKGTQTIKSIKIEGKGNEKLSGTATVTAYANGITPAVTMTGTDEASKSVTLDCGDGVELAPSTATDFIIALPPVLFSQGFAVTVTYSDDTTNTIETTTANTVLRSSILTMPTLVLNSETIEENEGNNESDILEIPMDEFTLSSMIRAAFVTNPPTPTLKFEIESYSPKDATEFDLTWSSSDETIAKVDQDGNITGIAPGVVIITAIATGGASFDATIKVYNQIDYIDEYGINHGTGVCIDNVIWAPVNCGYKAPTYGDDENVTTEGYPYGKLYQWGRKYGQGYAERFDETTPEIAESGVSLIGGQHSSNANKFYCGSSDWLADSDDTLWNNGTDDIPIKTKYDPCPEGWRIPTYSELEYLSSGHLGQLTTNSDGLLGCYIRGKVFLPAAGYRTKSAQRRYHDGYYWSSRPFYYQGKYYSYCLQFNGDELGSVRMDYPLRYYGLSVRCVQE